MTESLLGPSKEGLVFILSAPAGTGKTTLVRMLTKEFSRVVQSISYTTRKPRADEKMGVHYAFISKKGFEEKIASGDFLEYALVFNDYYGTCKKDVEENRKKGLHTVLVIDTQGALELRRQKLRAVFIFVSPPSIESLKDRLCARGSDCEQTMSTRLSWAKREMETAIQYDYHFINDDLDVAYSILRSIVIAETHKTAGA